MPALSPAPIELAAAILFALAVVHTFCTRWFEHLAHTQPAHAGVWHLLGEVETVFGFWAILLIAAMTLANGWGGAVAYIESRPFVEPMFVFAIMVVSASRPVMQALRDVVGTLAGRLPVPPGMALYLLSLSLVPLLGSVVTEPAAMTVAALMLRDTILGRRVSNRLKYATLGVLFVNVSIGGTLTNFAAPPVLMVAARWDWSTAHTFATLGWKAAAAVMVNAVAITLVFRREVASHAAAPTAREAPPRVPGPLVALHLALLAGVVASSHTPEIFLALLLLFLALAEAYPRHHDRLILREGLLVGLFLAGLVVLGGQQQWWLQAVLTRMDGGVLFGGAAGLTAITDNAALTYLGSLVEGLSDEFKYALVAGAVTGGGLTVIANAPNPAGFAILKGCFDEQAISPLRLFAAALAPTGVAAAALWGLRDLTLSWETMAHAVASARPVAGPFLLLAVPVLLLGIVAWNNLVRNKELTHASRHADHGSDRDLEPGGRLVDLRGSAD